MGPEEGYVWLCDTEITLIAAELGIPRAKFIEQYTQPIDLDVYVPSFADISESQANRYVVMKSLCEDKKTKDCVFLKEGRCSIYHVRPNQCRTWPFWELNLESPEMWNMAARRCKGINRGRRYSFEEIEAIRRSDEWWFASNG
jgi:Fe-S-cluster containining protein